jgi:hypothetical protein
MGRIIGVFGKDIDSEFFLLLSIRLVGCLCTYISDIDNQLPGKPSFIECQSNMKYLLSASMRQRM